MVVDTTLAVLVLRPEDSADLGQWQYGMGKRACEDTLLDAWKTDLLIEAWRDLGMSRFPLPMQFELPYFR